MRYGYWIDALLGMILIVSPYLGRFAQDHTALYTNVVLGILLVAWAIVSFLISGDVKAGAERHSHA